MSGATPSLASSVTRAMINRFADATPTAAPVPADCPVTRRTLTRVGAHDASVRTAHSPDSSRITRAGNHQSVVHNRTTEQRRPASRPPLAGTILLACPRRLLHESPVDPAVARPRRDANSNSRRRRRRALRLLLVALLDVLPLLRIIPAASTPITVPLAAPPDPRPAAAAAPLLAWAVGTSVVVDAVERSASTGPPQSPLSPYNRDDKARLSGSQARPLSGAHVATSPVPRLRGDAVTS